MKTIKPVKVKMTYGGNVKLPKEATKELRKSAKALKLPFINTSSELSSNKFTKKSSNFRNAYVSNGYFIMPLTKVDIFQAMDTAFETETTESVQKKLDDLTSDMMIKVLKDKGWKEEQIADILHPENMNNPRDLFYNQTISIFLSEHGLSDDEVIKVMCHEDEENLIVKKSSLTNVKSFEIVGMLKYSELKNNVTYFMYHGATFVKIKDGGKFMAYNIDTFESFRHAASVYENDEKVNILNVVVTELNVL